MRPVEGVFQNMHAIIECDEPEDVVHILTRAAQKSAKKKQLQYCDYENLS